ncbi:MAG: hypothetical protein JSW17_01925, partial [Candidatus Omnitrophota bacterium]
MKILIPFYLIIPGGIPRAIMLLLKELIFIVQKVVLVLPKDKITLFKENLPQTDKLILISSSNFKFKWLPAKLNAFLNFLINHLQEKYLITKHRITHCLYPHEGTFRPKLHYFLNHNIPIAIVMYDLYWTAFQGKLISRKTLFVNNHIIKCIKSADILFANSKATLDELNNI